MYALISLILVVALSMLIVRIGTIALTMTGMSREISAFQALSAFSGAGFTTGEAESVVAHPARRKVIAVLIRLGSVGVITAISTLVLSFTGPSEAPTIERLLVLVCGVLAVLAVSRSPTFDRALTPLIARLLQRYTTLELRDYAALLHLREDYRVAEVEAAPGNWLTKAPLGELGLEQEGVLVLGIERKNGEFVGTPNAQKRVEAGDHVLVYGRAARILELRQRRGEDRTAHERAAEEHREECARQPE